MISTKAVKPFVLLSKDKGLNIDSLHRNIPEMLSMKKASTVDIVELGKTNNPEQKIRITTFRDDKNNILELVHEYEGIEKPETHRLYRELPNYGDNSLKGRLVQLFENLDITGRFKAWQRVKTEKQYVKTSDAGEKTHLTIAKVTTDERSIQPISHETHRLTEYYVPKAHGGRKISPKFIEFETENQKEIPQITTIRASQNVNIPQDDEYLAMRIYDSESMKVPITRTALKERGLEGLEIPIENSYRMKEQTCGSFSENSGRIQFNSKYQDKPNIIETGFHEPEHAYQYALLGITNRLKNPYGDKCRAKFKGTITPRIEREAAMYEEGHLNYVQPEVNFKKYWENVLEECARDAANAGKRYYLQKGRTLSEQFKGIPSKEL